VIWASFNRAVADQKRLIGTWAFVSGTNSWGETTLTFAEDGKMQITSQWFGKKYDSEGTYTVKGNMLKMLVADNSDWGEASWGNWPKKDDGGKSDKSDTDAKAKQQNQPKQQREPILRRVTIRSLSETELVVADERGKKTVYARKESPIRRESHHRKRTRPDDPVGQEVTALAPGLPAFRGHRNSPLLCSGQRSHAIDATAGNTDLGAGGL
jgi:uncharacterized protein (TIGR03066 family)